MRFEFLNTWGGERGKQLAAHFDKVASETDVFCLHEATARTRDILGETLPGFTLISEQKRNWRRTRGLFEQTLAVAPGIDIVSFSPIFKDRKHAGLGIDAELMSPEGTLIRTSSVHGIVEQSPDSKLDTVERIMQSQVLIDLNSGYEHGVVIGGDFNLLRDTQSIGMFHKAGFRNLIDDYKIPTTRNHFVWDRYPDNPQLDADYVFVNPNVSVEDFDVLPDEISDHLALRLSVS